jgi:UDP-N-acetylglucosamine acyltransferase
VILANNSTLAGHIELGDNVTVGGLVAVHQFVRVGDFAYIGGKSAVVKDIPPYVIAAGDRATLHGLNNVGLKRHNFSKATLQELKKAYRIVFRIGLTVKQATERVKAEVEQIPEVVNFMTFIRESNRGVTR